MLQRFFLFLALYLLMAANSLADTIHVGNITLNTTTPDGYMDQTAQLDENMRKVFTPDKFIFLKRYVKQDSSAVNELYCHLLIIDSFTKQNISEKGSASYIKKFYNVFEKEKNKLNMDIHKANETIKNFGVSMNQPVVLEITKADDHASLITLTKYSDINDQTNWYYSINITEFLYLCNTFVVMYSYNNFKDDDIQNHVQLAQKQSDLMRDMLIQNNSSKLQNTNQQTQETKTTGSSFLQGFVTHTIKYIVIFGIIFAIGLAARAFKQRKSAKQREDDPKK